MKIFINYRRDDSADVTGRIYDRLVERYGEDSIFKDVDSIPFGLDFKEYLDAAVKKCDVLLVVIGNKWLKITDEKGKRKIDNETDWVRIELESALKREIPIIPLYVHNITAPTMESLPESLKGLVYRNGLLIRSDPDFHNDMNRLIKGIDELVVEKISSRETSDTPAFTPESLFRRNRIDRRNQLYPPPNKTYEFTKTVRATKPYDNPKPIKASQQYVPNRDKIKKSYFLGILIHLFTGLGLFYAKAVTYRKWLYPTIHYGALITMYLLRNSTAFWQDMFLTPLIIAFPALIAGIVETIITIKYGRE